MTASHCLAKIHVSRMKGLRLMTPIMMEFVDNLDKVNSLTEQGEGFVWRLQEGVNKYIEYINPVSVSSKVVDKRCEKRLSTTIKVLIHILSPIGIFQLCLN